ncbi:hypothetical protein GDO86_001209 [Hymenochirus boettgeri]|uniref:Plasmalemma vesicle associated protein n=1 Tax=Hymenochirus boettgeri TaxID=247094 RepID=A0A8T2KEW4_9PIPI|nr:hypothetical protein GDO86_001209 [Hymenochirus boettgeri]
MAKFGLESKDILRSNQKSCWYYFKYFFLFTSLIQFLIILGLVLFMVYDRSSEATEERLKNVASHLQDLTVAHKKLLSDNDKQNIKLNQTLKEKEDYKIQVVTMKMRNENLTKTVDFFHKVILRKDKDCEDKTRQIIIKCESEKRIIVEENKILSPELDRCKKFCKMTDPTKTTCTPAELQHLGKKFESAISTYVPATIVTTYEVQKQLSDIRKTCNPLPNHVVEIINKTLANLKQRIVDNTDLKVAKEQCETDIKKCNADRGNLISSQNTCNSEKQTLKEDISRMKKTSDDELNRSNRQLLIKIEELQQCQRRLGNLRSFNLFPNKYIAFYRMVR